MAALFDYHQFNYRLGKLLAHPDEVSFDERTRLIGQLRADYLFVGNKMDQTYVDRAIDELTLRTMIDTGQPFGVVLELYRRNAAYGFRSPWSEVHMTLEFAEYARSQGRSSEGLDALQHVKERLPAITKELTKGLTQYLMRETDMCIRRLRSTLSTDDPSKKKEGKKQRKNKANGDAAL